MNQDEELRRLINTMSALPLMTPDEKIAQGLDFAYGQLAASSNHKPAFSAFKKLALEKGWSEERFVAWADTRRWWIGPMLMAVPRRTPERLVELRTKMVASYADDGHDISAFTCDDCGARFTCALVFDGYNTNGDCLAEK